TRSELFIVMTGGMAGIAGTVLVVYATVLGPVIPDAPAHLVIASVIGAPAAILISLIMVPEKREAQASDAVFEVGKVASSSMDAVVRGTAAGLELLLNILRHADRAGRARAPRQRNHRPPARSRRSADHVATPARLRDGADLLAARHSLEGGGHRRQPDGDEDDPQRVHRLCGARQAAGRRARAALAPDHALCHVRLRQFRLARHHDRRAWHHGARTARRRAVARPQVDRVGDARDLCDRRDRRDAHVALTGASTSVALPYSPLVE